jgi:malate/lactate dehydrogenase
VEEIEVIEEQIAVLEEGLPRAPGMERAALFKEITAYSALRDARRQALDRCRARIDARA